MLKKLFLLSYIAVSLLFLSPSPLYAACPPDCNPNPFGGGANTINIGNQIQNRNLGVPAPAQGGIIGTVLKNVIALFFALGGLAVLIFFVWGAFDWITSGGDKEKVSSARKKMTNAIIGLILLALSYFIVGLAGEIAGFNPLGPLPIKSLGEQ